MMLNDDRDSSVCSPSFEQRILLVCSSLGPLQHNDDDDNDSTSIWRRWVCVQPIKQPSSRAPVDRLPSECPAGAADDVAAARRCRVHRRGDGRPAAGPCCCRASPRIPELQSCSMVPPHLVAAGHRAQRVSRLVRACSPHPRGRALSNCICSRAALAVVMQRRCRRSARHAAMVDRCGGGWKRGGGDCRASRAAQQQQQGTNRAPRAARDKLRFKTFITHTRPQVWRRVKNHMSMC